MDEIIAKVGTAACTLPSSSTATTTSSAPPPACTQFSNEEGGAKPVQQLVPNIFCCEGTTLSCYD